MDKEKIDALESIFGLSDDDLEEVKAGLDGMGDDENESAITDEAVDEGPPNTIMAKLSASVPMPEAFKFKDKNPLWRIDTFSTI